MTTELGADLARFGAVDGVLQSACPSRALLDHVTGKWGVLVVVSLNGRTLRWSELLRGIEGISEKMLAQTLRTLEADGVVIRHAYPVVPPHVEYRLSEAGGELAGHMESLLGWALDHSSARV
ncbi:winged helix-turn-helix transcriptional regulator [Mycetocola spongiae]|uniref:winged helix-turn-helix transcriptional regulator n=1 Tax=Mycetocola spongiae TaxID=2859226 RepID=UPI001CF47365|nr:helix-turn-helix domain-containing protein [Mycetocola spongiae]UCR88136.1 helix-turn-helix transcriptional regulator [Mycetocola spongiae]